jgi:prophage regulatory protein
MSPLHFRANHGWVCTPSKEGMPRADGFAPDRRLESFMRLLDYSGLRELGVTYSKSQLWRLYKAGKFPAPVRLSSQRNAYVESEVLEWMRAKTEARCSEITATPSPENKNRPA